MTDDVKRFGPGRMSPGTSGVGAFVVKNMSPVSSSNAIRVHTLPPPIQLQS